MTSASKCGDFHVFFLKKWQLLQKNPKEPFAQFAHNFCCCCCCGAKIHQKRKNIESNRYVTIHKYPMKERTG
jgi:hypothetical protein